MRLTRAELVMHEEFDWLAQVPLLEEGHRRAIAQTMRAVAKSVRAGDAKLAWQAGDLAQADAVLAKFDDGSAPVLAFKGDQAMFRRDFAGASARVTRSAYSAVVA